MATFGWSEEHVSETIPGAQGWAYYAWSILNRATVFGSMMEMAGDGYIKQEKKRILGQ